MSIFTTEPVAASVSFDAECLWVDLADGRCLGVPLAYFPRLLQASPEEREQCVINANGSGLHWDDLDEDVSVRGLLLGIGAKGHPMPVL